MKRLKIGEGFAMYLPKAVIYIIEKLIDSKFEAYVVGGCVRDTIMGIKPKDWDVTTNAKPDQIKHIFSNLKTVDTGVKYGTVSILIENQFYEITSYRGESKYLDYRRPSSVNFIQNIFLDLKRRDFAMNAIAYNPHDGIVDPFDGVCDIDKKIIKCVGNPEIRFEEDPLRILRGLRFAGEKGFVIEEFTYKAMCKYNNYLKYISKERIILEINKLLMSSYVKIVWEKYSNPIIGILDEQDSSKVNFKKYIQKIDKLSLLDMRIALLCMSLGIDTEHEAELFLRKLKYSSQIINRAVLFIFAINNNFYKDSVHTKKYLNIYGVEIFKNMLEFRSCILEEDISYFSKEIDRIILSEECFLLKNLEINGYEIKALGIKEGILIGKILRDLLNLVIEGKLENSKIELCKYSKDVYRKED